MSDFQTKFSTIICNLLEERGLSQKWLSDAAGVTEATISRYINGRSEPSNIEYLCNIASALNVSIDYLLGLNPISEKQELTNEEKLLINCYRRATNDDKEIIRISMRKYLTNTEKLYTKESINKQKKIG